MRQPHGTHWSDHDWQPTGCYTWDGRIETREIEVVCSVCGWPRYVNLWSRDGQRYERNANTPGTPTDSKSETP